MNRLRQILKDRRGVAFPLIIAIVLVLVMLMCCISEYFRLLIVAQGVRDAAIKSPGTFLSQLGTITSPSN